MLAKLTFRTRPVRIEFCQACRELGDWTIPADVERVLEVRKTYGGPAPSETSRAISESARLFQRDRDMWMSLRRQLDHAEAALAARAKGL